MSAGVAKVILAALELTKSSNLRKLRVDAMIEVVDSDHGWNPGLERADRVHRIQHQIKPALLVPPRTAPIKARFPRGLDDDAPWPQASRMIPQPPCPFLPRCRDAQLSDEIRYPSRDNRIRPPIP